MSEKVNDKSIVQVHYIGTYQETQEIFDTSRMDVAKEHGILNEQRDYEPLPVEMGKNKVIPGFEKALIGMEVGERKSVKIAPDEAYGMRLDEKIVEIGADQFKNADIEPQVGMMIQTSDGMATIIDYDGNDMVKLDFNHPLAGKKLVFDLEVVKIE